MAYIGVIVLDICYSHYLRTKSSKREACNSFITHVKQVRMQEIYKTCLGHCYDLTAPVPLSTLPPH